MIPFIVISGSISFSLRDISEESSCSFLYKPAQFIKQNSKEDSLFLIPLDWDVFRLCARRAVVVDLGTVFTDKAVVEWHTRILEVTKQKELIGPRDELQLKIGYHSLTDGDIRSLQKKYKFDYAAFEKEFLAQNYMFPVFYEDEKVIIYKTS